MSLGPADNALNLVSCSFHTRCFSFLHFPLNQSSLYFTTLQTSLSFRRTTITAATTLTTTTTTTTPPPQNTKLNKYSSRITEPKSQGASQAILCGVGLSDDDLNKPQIGISSVCLQSRDLIADSIEIVMSAQWYDGISLFLAVIRISCQKKQMLLGRKLSIAHSNPKGKRKGSA
ncbi:dihydroxy-acid dehydratase, chloroplastic [Tanacetum coccineum]